MWYVCSSSNCIKQYSPFSQEATIRSKHGVILTCDIGDPHDPYHAPMYQWLQATLKDQRFGFLPQPDGQLMSDDPVIQSRAGKVWAWLCEKMDQDGHESD